MPTKSGQLGPAAEAHAQSIATLPFTRKGGETDEKEIVVNSIRQDVEFLRSHPLVKETVKVTGWYQDLHDGLVHEVEV
jgi:carbonic anhydrase